MKTKKVIEAVYELGHEQGYENGRDEADRMLRDMGKTITELTEERELATTQRDAALKLADELQKQKEDRELWSKREENRAVFVKGNFEELRNKLQEYGSTGTGDWGEIMDLVDRIGQRVV